MAVRDLSCIKQFRNGLVQTIKNANIANIGSSVYSSKVSKVWNSDEAVVIVSIPNVTFNDGRTSPRFYTASCEVYVDIFARGYLCDEDNALDVDDEEEMVDFLDNTAKAICEAIEPCQKSVGPLNGLVKRFVLKGFTNNVSEKSETDRAAMRITFGCEFAFNIAIGGSALSEFEKAKNTLKNGVDGQPMEFVTNLRP